MKTLNSKTNESNKFIYQFTDKLNLKNPNKNAALFITQVFFYIYLFHKYKFKISAPTWNDTFDLPNGSYSVCNI